jgi:hypothetical protein
MNVTNAQYIDGLVHTAVRFGREVQIASLATHLFSAFKILLTQDETAEVCKRLGFFVTEVVKGARVYRVARYCAASRRGRKRSLITGLPIGGLVQARLDAQMSVGARATTKDAYEFLRSEFPDAAADLTAAKITRSLDPNRYRVLVGYEEGRSTRMIERVS